MATVEGSGPAPARLDRPQHRARTWATRTGVKVDRIACAWLIRRFVDPEAAFRFVPAQGYRPSAGELRLDLYAGQASAAAPR